MGYKRYLKNKSLQCRGVSLDEQESVERKGCLTLEDLQEAEHEIVRFIQEKEFPEARSLQLALNTGLSERSARRLMKKDGASMSKLNPIIEEGLPRAGGRIRRAPVPYDVKHPVLLPYKHHVTELIIREHHQGVGHLGQESVLSSLRHKYWILKGRSAVRKVLSKCIDCQKRKVKPAEQFMAELPKDRVIPAEPPFAYVGIDCLGPLEVKQGRSHVNRYGCLLTCLNVQAVHIEILHSLNADSMLNAMRRFISIRGCRIEIRSNNRTNFTRADNELCDAVEQWNHHKISNFCAQKEINCKFNLPAASHKGGIWERMIQTAKQVLKSILQEQIATDEILSTVMAEVVNIINSRPLRRNSDRDRDD